MVSWHSPAVLLVQLVLLASDAKGSGNIVSWDSFLPSFSSDKAAMAAVPTFLQGNPSRVALTATFSKAEQCTPKPHL